MNMKMIDETIKIAKAWMVKRSWLWATKVRATTSGLIESVPLSQNSAAKTLILRHTGFFSDNSLRLQAALWEGDE
jgi:hypothetical protein